MTARTSSDGFWNFSSMAVACSLVRLPLWMAQRLLTGEVLGDDGAGAHALESLVTGLDVAGTGQVIALAQLDLSLVCVSLLFLDGRSGMAMPSRFA